MSNQGEVDHEEFFRYTSGRWLWNEEGRLAERYRWFNVDELKKIAVASAEARQCVSMVKLAEGASNKVFRLVMDNGSAVIARIPNPATGQPGLTMASEVATMDFAKSILKIPVPKVLAWNAHGDNTVGSEYMIIEEAAGTQLGTIWPELELSQKLKVTEGIIAMEKQFLSVSFEKYGNLYFASDAFSGCERAKVSTQTPDKEEIEDRFVIGPVIDEAFWNKERATMDIDRGPWRSPATYLKAIGDREIAWISRYATPKASQDSSSVSESQNTPDSHIDLYQRFLKVAPYIFPAEEELVTSHIWHWDLHASNIFVNEDCEITGVIDWQDVWAGPLFREARQPKVIDYNGEMLQHPPDNYKDIQDEEEKARIDAQVEKSVVLHAYETHTRTANPAVHEVFHIPHGLTRRQLITFATNTWDGDIIPFRQSLIRIARHFSEFNSEVPCPIGFTNGELEHHFRDGEGWNNTAEFWDRLQGFITREGWTHNDDYEQAAEFWAEVQRLLKAESAR